MQGIGEWFTHIPSTNNLYTYSVHDVDSGRCLYVGYDRLAQVMNLAKLKGNPAFDVNAIYRTVIYSQHPTNLEAYMAVTQLIRKVYGDGTPPLNMTTRENRFSPVMCEQTGVIYRNASEACASLDIAQPRLSAHLARKPGHRTIKGLTFKYADYRDAVNKPDPMPADLGTGKSVNCQGR